MSAAVRAASAPPTISSQVLGNLLAQGWLSKRTHRLLRQQCSFPDARWQHSPGFRGQIRSEAASRVRGPSCRSFGVGQGWTVQCLRGPKQAKGWRDGR